MWGPSTKLEVESCSRDSVVMDAEAGRFQEVAGVSIVALGCQRSVVDTSTIDS